MGEGTRLQNDLEALRELLATYEQSIQRKDEVISNLTAGLQHHRNRMELQRSFTEWKVKHNDIKREVFVLCHVWSCSFMFNGDEPMKCIFAVPVYLEFFLLGLSCGPIKNSLSISEVCRKFLISFS